MGISRSERGRLSKDGELDSLTMLPISIPVKFKKNIEN